MMKVESYNILIGIFLVLTLICGAFTGHFFEEWDIAGTRESIDMFYPLILGFVFMFITYYLIEKREQLYSKGSKKEE